MFDLFSATLLHVYVALRSCHIACLLSLICLSDVPSFGSTDVFYAMKRLVD